MVNYVYYFVCLCFSIFGVKHFAYSYSGALTRKACAADHHGYENEVIYPSKKIGNHMTVHPTVFTPQAYQCKIPQSTGMVTQMQLDVIWAGNRKATGIL